MPLTIHYGSLAPPAQAYIDVVDVALAPTFAAASPAVAMVWKKRILVLCARALGVSGASMAVLVLSAEELSSGIARILTLCLPNVEEAGAILNEAIQEALSEYAANPSSPPPPDFTPNDSFSSQSPEPHPPGSHFKAQQAHKAQQDLLAAASVIAETLARQLSVSLAPHSAAASPALQQTLTRTLEASRTYFSSSESSPGEGGQPGLPVEVRWPRGHSDLPLLLRTLEVFARAYHAVKQDPPRNATAIITALRASGRSVNVDFVTSLLNQDPMSALSLAEIAVIADPTLPESALSLLRLARVARPRTAAEVTSARKGEYISPPPGYDMLPIREARPAGANRSAPRGNNESTARTSPSRNHSSPQQPQQNNRQGGGRRGETQVS